MRSEELADRLKNDYPENNKNKVALIDVSGRGGISHHVFMLGDALTHSGLDVTVLTTKDCEFVPEGSSLTVRKVFRAHHTRRSNLMKGLIYTISLFRIIGEIRRERPDIVHWQEIKLPGLERHLIACFSHMGIGSVLSVHDVLHFEKGVVSNPLRRLYKQFDQLIAHAEDSKEQIVKFFGLSPDRIDVIPVGEYSQMVQFTQSRERARKQLGVPGGARVLLFFGYIRRYKGLDLLLQAVADVRESVSGLHLIIAGEPKEDFSKYDRIIAGLGLSDIILRDIRYIPLKEVSEYFAASDIVVLPYRKVYQSGLLYLAFAHYKPVIASKVGGVAEVVRHGENGFLVTPENVEELGYTIVEAFNDPDELERMGTTAYNHAKQTFSWSGIAESTSHVYQDVMKRVKPQDRA